MSLRTVLPLEYRSDALLTVIRFILCLLPPVLLWTAMFNTFPRIELNASGEPDPEYLITVTRIQILNTAWIAAGVFTFAVIQMASRASYLSNQKNRAQFLWQALHGWDGSSRGTVYRPLVPLTEWGLLTLTCVLTIQQTGEWWIRIPCTWVCARLLLQTWAYAYMSQETRRGLFYWFAGAWFLVGAYCLAPNNLLGLLCLSLLIGMHLKLDSTMSRRQIQAWNEQPESLNASQALNVLLQDHKHLKHKFIAEILSPQIRDWRPDWPTTLTSVGVWVWLICTVAWSVESHSLQYWSQEELPGNDSPHRMFGPIMVMTLILYLLIFMLRFKFSEGIHWLPRLGLLGRLRTGRLIVPSYDRVFLPILISLGVMHVDLYFTEFVGIPPLVWFGMFQAAMLIILLKAPPSDPEFQMTADAKLSKSSYLA